jgi:hypothetical protein
LYRNNISERERERKRERERETNRERERERQNIFALNAFFAKYNKLDQIPTILI